MLELVKLSPKLNFLRPYVNMAFEKYPESLFKLKEIYLMKPLSDRKHQSYGIAWHDTKQDTYKIGLRIKYQEIVLHRKGTYKVKLINASMIDLLRVLAHEISHVLGEWEHTPTHSLVENDIMGDFLIHLIDTGYVSEEVELAILKNGDR